MKTFFLSLLSIIVLVLIVAALMPKTFELHAQTIINAPKDKVRNYGKLFANQVYYSVRVMADPQVKLTYSGVDGTVGMKQSRDSLDPNVGAGEQEITAIHEGTSIDVEVRFVRPMVATNYARGIYTDLGNGTTQVSQIFTGANPRPTNIISAFFLPQVQQDMQSNMNNLKVILDKPGTTQ